jgi:acetyl-CoA carboxylase biotin carboxyl carrier protein
VALDDDDVREILRIIDESELDEIRVETEGLSLHVVRGDAGSPSQRVEVDVEAAQVPGETGDAVTIVAPMLGTFYRAPAPGAAPFVEVGAAVEPNTIVCIIEVMKMMNSVHAGVTGTIAEVWVENGEPVEYGTPLFRVEP